MLCMEPRPASSTSVISTRILKVRNSLELSAREKLVARVLLDYIGNRPDGICWPSLSRVAQEASVSVRTVQRAVQGLRDKGYISIDPRYREDGSQTSSIYRWLDTLSPGGGDRLASEHTQHQKKPRKQHVQERSAPCALDSDGGSQQQPRLTNGKERISRSKRFVEFESDPKKFRSYDACEEAHAAAVDAGFISNSESDQILFWTCYAAVCRKLKAKKVSYPARLLRVLLDSRRAMIEYSTQADEDAARKGLKAARLSS
jgi:GntR family transcriptional regulator